MLSTKEKVKEKKNNEQQSGVTVDLIRNLGGRETKHPSPVLPKSPLHHDTRTLSLSLGLSLSLH